MTEKEFIGILLRYRDSSDIVRFSEVIRELEGIDGKYYIDLLSSKDFIKVLGLDDIQILPPAIEFYSKKEDKPSIRDYSKPLIKRFWSWFLGIISALIVAFLVYFFGWK